MFIWYLFFYTLVFSFNNPVSVGWIAFILLLLASFGVFASPMTRHLSFWNKVIDKVIKKETDKFNE